MKKMFLFAALLLSLYACEDHPVQTSPGTGTDTTGIGMGPGGTGPGGGTNTTSLAVSTNVTTIMTTTAATTACASSTGLAKVVCLTEAFKATLDATQLASIQLPYNLANVQKWSNLPAGLSSRYGIKLGLLNDTQLVAFRDLMQALLGAGVINEGYDEMIGNLVADNYLTVNGGGTTYGAGNFYVSILGTPSITGQWELLFTGHHFTQPYNFNGSQGMGYTPAFRGVEPTIAVSNASNNRTYQPMEQERQTFAALLTGLSSSEQTAAKLSATFTDLVLAPGQDWKFPATKSGIRAGDLSADKQALILNAIKLYVSDLDVTSAAAVLAKYTSELDDTYIAYSGSTSVTAENDYIRIDGPSVWIEFSYQGGIIIRNTPHPHSVWRDRITDYGGTK